MELLDRLIAWLREGYPAGVPDRDYLPLMALLRRRLTDDEIHDLGEELVAKHLVPADRVDVGTGILKRTDELPTEDELLRVADHLRDCGWDVEDRPLT